MGKKWLKISPKSIKTSFIHFNYTIHPMLYSKIVFDFPSRHLIVKSRLQGIMKLYQITCNFKDININLFNEAMSEYVPGILFEF